MFSLSCLTLRLVRRNFIARNVHASRAVQDIIIEYVPPLGESITEGSIAKWVKSPGEKVEVDDVICVIETDKVTVDIKSKYHGNFVEQLSKASATIFVGAPLYKIDAVGAIASANSEASPVPTIQSFDSETVSKSHSRTPLIKFKGKRKNTPADTHPSTPSISTSTPKISSPPKVASTSKVPIANVGNGVDFWTLNGGASFGRPVISAAEIDAVESGGASLFDVKAPVREKAARK
eukprot:gene1118-2177_t